VPSRRRDGRAEFSAVVIGVVLAECSTVVVGLVQTIHGFLAASTGSRGWSAFADHDGKEGPFSAIPTAIAIRPLQLFAPR
jgi:hypothetical protein